MLHFDDIVFGPIFSRRLGSSLGVNLLPSKGKLCNFDCVYCECGWNKDGIAERIFPRLADVEAAMEQKMSKASAEGVPVDSITFSGNGEPTMNPDFPEIIDVTLRLRDKYFPNAKVSVLSNATLIGRKAVAQALMKVDNPILKIDAPEPLEAWRNIVRELRPRQVMVYTIDRETPDKSLGKYTVEEMTAFVQPLIDEGFDVQVRG